LLELLEDMLVDELGGGYTIVLEGGGEGEGQIQEGDGTGGPV